MSKTPNWIVGSLQRYVDHGIEPSSFLYAVLTNDLMGAVSKADYINIRILKEICEYVYNDIPCSCWGSFQKVEEWIEKGGLKGNKQVNREVE